MPMTMLKIADETRCIAMVTPLRGEDPLAGTELLGEPTVYWERPLSGEVVAGWGEAMTAEIREPAEVGGLLSEHSARWLMERPESLPGPWFGGMRFAASGRDKRWAPFGFGRWVVPEVLVWRDGPGLMAAIFVREGRGAEDVAWAKLRKLRSAFPTGRYRPARASQSLRIFADRQDFESRVERTLEAIQSGAVSKVVLARAVEVEGESAFDRVAVLARLRMNYPGCTTFCFQAPDGTAFLGATPETLCRLEGRNLETEALAGSAPPAQAGTLGKTDKDRREHQAVVGYILKELEPLVEHVEADAEPSLLSLKNVVHLRTGIRARLRETVEVGELVAALHPTPAVGGTPCERALAYLAEHETMDRGWYAGPVGWVGCGRANLKVGLRSALVKGARARLFVGAGIVAGSTAESEWRETEIKSLAMLKALGGDND
jgi:isochorismate synthase